MCLPGAPDTLAAIVHRVPPAMSTRPIAPTPRLKVLTASPPPVQLHRRQDPRVVHPLAIPWQPKSVDSARWGVDTLPDGRVHCWIEHEVVRGVTPAMLAWWFRHLEGDIDFAGVRAPRYRVWHPRDHVQVHYHRRRPDGSVGPGAVLHLTEMLGARREYLVDVKSPIVRLDEGGFGHRPRLHGLPVAAMDYTFTAVPGGTRYVNSLTVGFKGAWARPLNALIRRLAFDEAHGRAWVRHNVEEVGQFERFLPPLYALEGPRAD